MFELPGVFRRPFHLHPIENLLRRLCIPLLRTFSLLYQKWHHLSRIFMSCIQKGLCGKGVSSSALLWSCVPLWIGSCRCSALRVRLHLPTLEFEPEVSAGRCFTISMIQFLQHFHICKSKPHISDEREWLKPLWPDSKVSKDRQINNEHKCNPANGKTYDGLLKRRTTPEWAWKCKWVSMCMSCFRALGVVCFILLADILDSPQWNKSSLI